MKYARTKQLNSEFVFIFVNEELQSSRYFTGLLNNLYNDHSAIFMRLSSDINDVFHLGNSDN